jgi:hypothetical protein
VKVVRRLTSVALVAVAAAAWTATGIPNPAPPVALVD